MGKANDKGCALAFFSFEMNTSSMLVNDHGARNSQALPRSLAYFLGGEEGIEDTGAHLFWDSGSGVSYSNLHPLGKVKRLYPDFSLLRATFSDNVINGMGGIDDQIQNHL